MSQDLLEQDIKLHIVTDQEFRFTKTNVSKQFLGEFHDKISWNVDCNNFWNSGLDATSGYTSKDFKGRVVGDPDLRRQAKMSRNALGVCASLALRSNGNCRNLKSLKRVI